MGMSVIVTGDRNLIEHKVRILKTLIELDKRKKDAKSLANHQIALKAHEEKLEGDSLPTRGKNDA